MPVYERTAGYIMNISDNKKIGCVIMASGLSKRFGSNKLIKELGGMPVIKWVLDVTEDLFACRVVVTRSQEVKTLCENMNVPVLYHEYPGRNDTVRIGLNAMPEEVEGCMFCMADQPLIQQTTIKNMIAMFNERKGIVRPIFEDSPGAPILFPDKYFEELRNLPQGKGGNVVVKAHPDDVYMVSAGFAEELFDIDTEEDFSYILDFTEKYNV